MSAETYQVAETGKFKPFLPQCLREDAEIQSLVENTSTKFPSSLRRVSTDDVERGLVLPMKLIRKYLLGKSERKKKLFSPRKREVVVVLKGEDEKLRGFWRFHDQKVKSIPRLEGGWKELHEKGVIAAGNVLLLEFVPHLQIIGIKKFQRSPPSPQEGALPSAAGIIPSLCLTPGKDESPEGVIGSPFPSAHYSSDNTVSALCLSWGKSFEASVSPPGEGCDHTHMDHSSSCLASKVDSLPVSLSVDNQDQNYFDRDSLSPPYADGIGSSFCVMEKGKEDFQDESIAINPNVEDYYFPPLDTCSPNFCGLTTNVASDVAFVGEFIQESVVDKESKFAPVDNIGTSFILTLKDEDFQADSVLRVCKNDVELVQQLLGTAVENEIIVEYSNGSYLGTVEITVTGERIVLCCWKKVLQGMKAEVEDVVICQFVTAGKMTVVKYT